MLSRSRPPGPAGRGRFVSALFRWQDGATVRAGDYANTTLDGLAALIVEPTLVCGEVGTGEARRLAELAPIARVVCPALGLRRGESDDPDRLEPVYLHGPAGGAGGAEGAAEVGRPGEPIAVE